MKVYIGILDFFYETGMKHIVWVLDTMVGSDRIIEIEGKDHLVIFSDELVTPIFNGEIIPVYPYPSVPGFWIQKNYDEKTWKGLFFPEEKFQAVLIKNLKKGI